MEKEYYQPIYIRRKSELKAPSQSTTKTTFQNPRSAEPSSLRSSFNQGRSEVNKAILKETE